MAQADWKSNNPKLSVVGCTIALVELGFNCLAVLLFLADTDDGDVVAVPLTEADIRPKWVAARSSRVLHHERLIILSSNFICFRIMHVQGTNMRLEKPRISMI